MTVNPQLSIVLGVALFGDVRRGGARWVSLEVRALAALVVGLVVLTRSPLAAGADGGRVDGEMLGGTREGDMMAPPIEAMP